jgi:hypothetical protein
MKYIRYLCSKTNKIKTQLYMKLMKNFQRTSPDGKYDERAYCAMLQLELRWELTEPATKWLYRVVTCSFTQSLSKYSFLFHFWNIMWLYCWYLGKMPQTCEILKSCVKTRNKSTTKIWRTLKAFFIYISFVINVCMFVGISSVTIRERLDILYVDWQSPSVNIE